MTPDLVLTPGAPPLVHIPERRSAAGAAAWTAEHRDELLDVVQLHGAVLIRGLPAHTADDVQQVGRPLLHRPIEEREAFARRSRYGDGVYSSSAWPHDEPMCMHHELSYAVEVPRLLLFACLVAPRTGGATAVADAQAVLHALPPALVARFEREGWLLTRTYRQVGLPWSEAFGTTDRAAVDDYCRRNAIEHEWLRDGGLRTRQRRAAVVCHPTSGERVWFNQAAFLNEWTMDPAVREYLVDTYGQDELPYNTRYGDGQPIEAGVVRTINEVYQSATGRRPWQAGDLLLLDNVRMAHSREPFEGPREVVVMMGDPVCLHRQAAAMPAGGHGPAW